MSGQDVIVVGAGIVGAACARELQMQGRSVLLLERHYPGGGVTAAGMGHLVALDETQDELDLCLLSLRRWKAWLARKGGMVEHHACGTLWVAEDEEQMAHALARAERLGGRGWDASLVSGDRLRALEPALRPGLKGALRVSGDSVVYPPAVAQELCEQLLAQGGQLRLKTAVRAIGAGMVELETGEKLHADAVVLATGVQTTILCPDIPVFPRKGHLAITDRYPGRLAHQVVSMGYGQSAAGSDTLAVAANVQPRPTGQWLVGSCRQDGIADTAVDPGVLAQVLRSAIALLPCLSDMRIIRSWTGLRPATPDGRPFIGRHPWLARTWLALGHEGLGVTTAFGTAQLLADLMLERVPALDPAHYAAARMLAPAA